MAATLHSEDGDVGFQIAPMVDVVFVLMLFFMACIGAMRVEGHLQARLPGGGSTEPDITPIVIFISPEGVVSMNDRVYGQADDHDLAELRSWLIEARQTFGTQDPVVIRPSPATQHGRLMDVLNCAAAAEVRNPVLG